MLLIIKIHFKSLVYEYSLLFKLFVLCCRDYIDGKYNDLIFWWQEDGNSIMKVSYKNKLENMFVSMLTGCNQGTINKSLKLNKTIMGSSSFNIIIMFKGPAFWIVW